MTKHDGIAQLQSEHVSGVDTRVDAGDDRRVGELLEGLPGLASNLLSARLEVMQDQGLVVRQPGPDGGMVYALTEEGEATAPALFELARFGGRHAPDEDLKRPGNLRTVVVTMREALRRVVGPEDVVDMELTIDDESSCPRPSSPNT